MSGMRGQLLDADRHEPANDDASSDFETFFRTRHLRLQGALFLMTGNREEAKELMQDAFLKLWERWDRVRRMEDRDGYLYRTAMNGFRSRYRRAKLAALHTLGLARSPDRYGEVDERDRLTRALDTLPPRQRAALVLTELLEFSSDEAGSLLSVKPATARVLAHQARAALRPLLEEHDG
jgi:RNA polymerase sigma factor (sigma-70 family)